MLKILIVEDDASKLRKITQALSKVEECDIEGVTSVTDVTSAKKWLREISYDLLILDIMLPGRIDQEVDEHAGIDLLNEVMQRGGYKIPMHIIGITAYSEVLTTATERFSQHMLTAIHYDPTSDQWERSLRARVWHIIAAKHDQASMPCEYRSHLAVICALGEPELSSVCHIGWSWKQIRIPNDETIYYQGEFLKGGDRKIVHAAAAGRMGMPAATALSMKMIFHFRPEYLAMTGITAGIPGKMQFGDVIIADPSWDYGSGKWVVRDGKATFMPAPRQLPLAVALRNRFKLLEGDAAVLALIRQNWPGEPPKHPLSLRVGPLASGAAVLADGFTAEAIISHNRELLGIEMETYGVFAAAEEADDPRPSVFSMKSIVDFADGHKDDRYQKYASYTSAQVLKHFMEHCI